MLPGVIHHVGAAVKSITAALPTYEAVLGYRVLSGPFEDPIQRVSVCFVGSGRQGEPLIELVEPAADSSPLTSFLAKGIGAYHVCYEVGDLEAALAHARAHGCVVLGEPAPAVAFDGRQIAWFYLPSRQLVELLEAE
jgi:methylmalonyl-CoA/ethylmalonyl-CoA epimerase